MDIDSIVGDKLSRDHTHMTKREKQLVRLAGLGLRNKEIAFRLGISENTVKVYMTRMMAAHRVPSRWLIPALAIKRGLMTVEEYLGRLEEGF